MYSAPAHPTSGPADAGGTTAPNTAERTPPTRGSFLIVPLTDWTTKMPAAAKPRRRAPLSMPTLMTTQFMKVWKWGRVRNDLAAKEG